MDSMYKILSCPSCGKGKTNKTHSFGSYRIYFNGNILKLKCRTCGYILRFRIIRGGI